MKKIQLISLLILSSCHLGSDGSAFQSLSVQKQKMRLVNLEKKLERAKEIEAHAKIQLEELKEEVDSAKVYLIRKELDDFEKTKRRDGNSLFAEEREALYDLIQKGPSSASFEAQIELDRILRIITEFSDEEYVF